MKKGTLITIIVVAVLLLQLAATCALIYFAYKNGAFDALHPNGGADVGGENGGDDTDEGEIMYNSHGYQISALEINGSIASVFAEVPDSCAVAVRIADEDSYFTDGGRSLRYIDGCLGAQDITVTGEPNESGVYTVELSVDIAGEMPEYFVAEAVLLDASGAVISSPSYDIRNTSRYKEFDRLTADNYTGEGYVVRFDESDASNFGVLADDVKRITASYVSPLLYPEYGYDIVDPSLEINRGDKIYVTDGENSVLCKVFWVKKNGNTVFVEPTEGVYGESCELKDFYRLIKIDADFSENAVVDGADGSVQLLSGDIISEGLKIGVHPFSFEHEDGLEIDGTVHGGNFFLEGKCVYDCDLLGEDHFELEVKSNIRFDFSADITVKVGSDGEELEDDHVTKELFGISVPTAVPGLLIKAEFSAYCSWEASGTVSIKSVPVYADVAFKVSNTEGYKSLGNKVGVDVDENDDWLDCSGAVELRIGPEVSIGVTLIGSIVTTEVEASGGLVIRATTEQPERHNLAHKCKLCIDGSVSFKFDVSVSASIGITEKFRWKPLSFTVYSAWVPDIISFYISSPSDGGALKFGFGDCQNYNIKATLRIQCDEVEEFICNIYDLRHDGDVLIKQEESDSFSISHGGYGRHKHRCKSAVVTVKDASSGEVLNELTITYHRDQGGDLKSVSYDGEEEFEIPLTTTAISVSIQFTCEYFECAIEEGYTFEKWSPYDITHPTHTVTHEVNYTVYQSFKLVRYNNEYIMFEGIGYTPSGYVTDAPYDIFTASIEEMDLRVVH